MWRRRPQHKVGAQVSLRCKSTVGYASPPQELKSTGAGWSGQVATVVANHGETLTVDYIGVEYEVSWRFCKAFGPPVAGPSLPKSRAQVAQEYAQWLGEDEPFDEWRAQASQSAVINPAPFPATMASYPEDQVGGV
jgi:hypothetical protein